MKIKSDRLLKEIKYFSADYFKDFRGEIWTNWSNDYFKNIKFNLDKFTYSKKNVLRGFHSDQKSWKLVTCLKGEILNVIVDYRKDSKNYLKYTAYTINEKNKISLLIHPMFLNSWLCLSKNCLYQYKYSFKGKYSDIHEQISIKWNDERIKFNWPIKKPILSKRDK